MEHVFSASPFPRYNKVPLKIQFLGDRGFIETEFREDISGGHRSGVRPEKSQCIGEVPGPMETCILDYVYDGFPMRLWVQTLPKGFWKSMHMI